MQESHVNVQTDVGSTGVNWLRQKCEMNREKSLDADFHLNHPLSTIFQQSTFPSLPDSIQSTPHRPYYT